MYIIPLSSLPTIQSTENSVQTASASGIPFSSVMQQAMQSLQESQQAAAQDTYDLAYGNASDLHTIMINSTKETASVEAVVQLTSRAVSAYKEIMQMQI